MIGRVPWRLGRHIAFFDDNLPLPFFISALRPSVGADFCVHLKAAAVAARHSQGDRRVSASA